MISGPAILFGALGDIRNASSRDPVGTAGDMLTVGETPAGQRRPVGDAAEAGRHVQPVLAGGGAAIQRPGS